MSTTGDRNAPCPCGSGKKFKKCHGAAGAASPPPTPDVATATRLKAADMELAEELTRFGNARLAKGWVKHALAEFLGGDDEELDRSEAQIAIPWMQFQYEIDDGPVLAARFLAERGRKLTSDKRALLEASLASWFSVHEVRRVDRGVGVLIGDLFTGAEHFIHDVSVSNGIGVRDTVLASIITCGGVSFFGGFHPRVLPPREADAVVTTVCRPFALTAGAADPDAMRNPDLRLELIDTWRDAVDTAMHRPPPTLANTDGDPLLLTTDHFIVESEEGAALVDRLATLAGADPPTPGDDEGSTIITVSVPGNAQHRSWTNTLIGRLIVTPDALRIETNSTRRADRLRDAMIAHVGSAVRFRMRDETTQQDLAARAGRAPRDGHHEPVSPALAAAAREVKERHMMAWLDEPIPALGGLTPRQAAATPPGRPALDLLLREFEHHEARGDPAQRVDVSMLLDALDIP